MSLLILGTMAYDHVLTPHGDSGKILGGAALYAALSASLFEVPVAIVSVVGNDFPEEELQALRKRRIDIQGVQRSKDKPSFFWKGSYHKDMNSRDTLDTQLGALLDFEGRVPQPHTQSDFLLLGNLDPSIQLKVLNQMHKRPCFVVLDTMNFWMDTALDALKAVLPKVDMLIINDSEAIQLSEGESNLLKAAHIIRQMGATHLLIKKGAHGSILFYGEDIFVAPAFLLQDVFDPTGAGDTFAGALMGYIAKQGEPSFDNLKAGMILAAATATFCIEDFGLQGLQKATYTSVLQRSRTLSKMASLHIPQLSAS